ncbi:zona pellucida-like domain-containing protein 1 [Etheostoma spectabile]|uniref:zona pellucida-like domain-containing protein 1 n=1 Tax=Etheostoma spectabile TaxID=54343 RepID=UPI0013AFA59F|nr:zona pellucida-like domain-containing protein 1 [Etheostoma spectabile]
MTIAHLSATCLQTCKRYEIPQFMLTCCKRCVVHLTSEAQGSKGKTTPMWLQFLLAPHRSQVPEDLYPLADSEALTINHLARSGEFVVHHSAILKPCLHSVRIPLCFISTLSMKLFSDVNYTKLLAIPQLGIELRTTVYVEVKATNLTGQYDVLLDRCYASISTVPSYSSFFNLFVPCSKDQFTTMIENGDSQSSRFNFPAFRFIEQQNQTVSTYYLHCITRLCEISTCSTFKNCNKRRKRNTLDTSLTKTYTISSSKIITKANSNKSKEKPLVGGQKNNAGVGLLAFLPLFALSPLVSQLCVAKS